MLKQTKKNKVERANFRYVKVSLILLVIMTSFLVVSLSSCVNNSNELDVFDAVTLVNPSDVAYKFDWRKPDKAKDGVYQSSISGFGEVEMSIDLTEIDFDDSDKDIEEFLESIEFICESQDVERGSGNLKNGDKVKVKIKYSKSEAKDLGIDIASVTKTFKVKLKEIYRNKEDISKTDLNEIISNIDECAVSNNELINVYYAYYLDNAGEQYLSLVTVYYDPILKDYDVLEYLIENDTNKVLCVHSLKLGMKNKPDYNEVKRLAQYSGKEYLGVDLIQ